MTRYKDFPAPLVALGAIRITCDGKALTGCDFLDQDAPPPPGDWQRADDDPILGACQGILETYFAGGPLALTLPLAPRGTDFQRQVWNALLEIPLGQTRSYGDIARRIGRPSSVRAVAGAIGRNPIGILIPCHRVIGSDGSLTGYAGGLHRKQALLALEGRTAPGL